MTNKNIKNMRIPNRRYISRLIYLIPIIWFIISIIFLQYHTSIRDSIDIQVPEVKITHKRIELDAKPLDDIKIVERKMDRQINNEENHVVHDNRKQVIAPVIDDKKIDSSEPGEMGKPVEINKSDLLPGELQKYEDGFEKNAFNAYVSDMISLHRSLPDIRDSDCRKIEYKAPIITASVVMCFHNEAWSVLLRSIHSIIDRSPTHVLKEIILVDDFSDMDHLKKPLDDYIANLKIVSVIRQTQREGLIRSRLIGAAAVKSDAIVFLDSHIEATEGWLEPLLDPISQNYTNVVTPIIDIINDTTFQYTFFTSDTVSVGGFNWNLYFTWHNLPEREIKKRTHHLEPAKSPTMAGGLFAISKQYFNDLGTYDDGMDIWGGENLEISFRIWMCGGTLLTAPCSHIGHIFRKRSPYKWLPGMDSVKKNSIRVAEVWLDEYKKYYYERINNDLGDFGDVTARKLLRQKLQCQSFKWYISEIYPELFIPGDAIASGEIRNLGASFCIDGSADETNFHKPVIGYLCHGQGGNQYFMLTPTGEIRRDEGCLDFAGGEHDVNKDDTVIVLQCHGEKENQYWIYNENNQLYHPRSDLCMILSEDNQHIRMQTCELQNTRHRWSWKRNPMNATN